MPLDLALINQTVAEFNAATPFSGVVLVREEDATVFGRGYGLANRADAIPNRIDTRFGTASGCKIFTAVAILHLIDAGKLALNTPLKDCAGVDLPHWETGAVTVRHLLTHSSGIPDYFDEEELDAQGDYADLWRDRPIYTMRTPRDFLPLFVDKPMKFAPGARFHYNNGGYIVLAQIVTHISGQPFTEYVTEHVFAPAGMTDSGYFALDQLPAHTAYGYVEHEDGTWKTNIFDIPIVGGGDGGAFVTAPDMSKFWAALRDYKLLTQATTDAMLSPQIAVAPDDGKHYGYGVWIDQRDGAVFRQGVVGADPGVAFVSGVFPAHHAEITIIGNTESPTWGLSEALTAALFPETP